MKDKIDMWIEMFGDTPDNRRGAGIMNSNSVKEVYEVWQKNGRDSNIAMNYIVSKYNEIYGCN